MRSQSSYIGRSDAQFDSANSCLGTIRDPEFADNALHVNLGRSLAYGQCLRDLLVGLPCGHQSEDLRLTGCERVIQRLDVLRFARVWLVLFLFGQLSEESCGQFLVEWGLAVERSEDSVDQAFRGGILEHVAGGAGIQRFEEVVGVLVHGHHQHAYAWMVAFDLAGRRDAVHLGHAYVHQYEIRPQTPAHFDGLQAGRRLADYLQSGFAAKQAPEPPRQKMVIVSEDEPLYLIGHGRRPPYSSAVRPPQSRSYRIPVRCEVRTSHRVRIPSGACPGARPSRQGRYSSALHAVRSRARRPSPEGGPLYPGGRALRAPWRPARVCVRWSWPPARPGRALSPPRVADAHRPTPLRSRPPGPPNGAYRPEGGRRPADRSRRAPWDAHRRSRAALHRPHP